MSFGGGPRTPPKPSPLPKAGNIVKGSVFETERRKRAQGRSGTLLSRGMLGDPILAAAQLANALG